MIISWCRQHSRVECDQQGRAFARVEVDAPRYRTIDNWPEFRHPIIRYAVPEDNLVPFVKDILDPTEMNRLFRYDTVEYRKERWMHKQWVTQSLTRCYQCKAIVEEGFWYIIEWEALKRVGS